MYEVCNMASWNNCGKKTVAKLKEELRKMGAKVSGNKQELLERLEICGGSGSPGQSDEQPDPSTYRDTHADRQPKGRKPGARMHPYRRESKPSGGKKKTLMKSRSISYEGNFVQPHIEEVQKYVDENGFKGLQRFLQRLMSTWRDTPLNVAVVGQAGVGKSTLINTFRDLKPCDEGAAEVGVIQTTMKIRPYPYPENDKLIFWDLPGMGTPDFTREIYLKKVKSERYDFFIIVASERFHENDHFLARKVREKGKKFVYVRSKADQDLKNEKEDHPHRTAGEVIETIRSNIKESLEESGTDINELHVFVINCKRKRGLEFPNLIDFVLENLDVWKREVMILSLRPTTKKAIETKKEALQKRIWMAAYLAEPSRNTGSELGYRMNIVKEQLEFYTKQFGLDGASLDRLAEETGKDVNLLKAEITNKDILVPECESVKSFVCGLIGEVVTATVLENYFFKHVPLVLHDIVKRLIFFPRNYYILSEALDRFAKDAEDVIRVAFS